MVTEPIDHIPPAVRESLRKVQTLAAMSRLDELIAGQDAWGQELVAVKVEDVRLVIAEVRRLRALAHPLTNPSQEQSPS